MEKGFDFFFIQSINFLSEKDLKRARERERKSGKSAARQRRGGRHKKGGPHFERVAISLMAFKWKIQADLMSEAFDGLMWKLNLNHSLEKAANRR